MSSKIEEYTITVFTENRTGLLTRVVGLITKRHINIESLSVSKSSIEGIHRFTIAVMLTEDRIRKLVSQIDKQVDVLKAFYYTNAEVVHQELALYKVPAQAFFESKNSEQLLRAHSAKILSMEPDYIVIEKTGHQHETEQLLEELREIGVYEFVRSGRVAIVKPMERLNNYLRSVETQFNN